MQKALDITKVKTPEDGEDGRVTEQALLRRLTTSIIGILLCLTAICISTWSLFDYGEGAGYAQSVVAGHTATVSVYCGEQQQSAVNDKYILTPGVEYVIELSVKGDNATGYFIVYMGDKRYVSEQASAGRQDQARLTLTVTSLSEITVVENIGLNSLPTDQRHLLFGESYLDFTKI